MFKITILSVLLSVQVYAADLNLNGGDSAIIEANVSTRVTCGGNSHAGSCTDIVSGFANLMEACQRSYSGGSCVDRLWSNFKAANPNCFYAGISICLEACQRSYSGGSCAEKCQ